MSSKLIKSIGGIRKSHNRTYPNLYLMPLKWMLIDHSIAWNR